MTTPRGLGTGQEGTAKSVCAVGLIGTGQYGTALLCQAQAIPRIRVSIVCDRNLAADREACLVAGIPAKDIVPCRHRKEAIQRLQDRRTVIVEDSGILLSSPVDVVVECTGNAEAGASHALQAIREGKHVAMVTKETDVVVGSLLRREADGAGLAYTPVDGDQHGLLIRLVSWCRALGLEVIVGGKARDSEFVLEGRRLVRGEEEILLSPDQVPFFRRFPPGEASSYLEARNQALSSLSRAEPFDLCELTVAANAALLSPDVPRLHAPILRTREIPEALGLKEEGGILSASGRVEAVSCLRTDQEAGLGGGVFCVVRSHNPYSRRILSSKGCITDDRGDKALIYRPFHLCGVETATTVLAAADLGDQANVGSKRPRFDMVCEATAHWKKGEILNETRWGRPGVRASILPYAPLANSSPLPYFMAMGCVLSRDVSPGETIDLERIVPPEGSVLWSLREEQDRLYEGLGCP